MKLGYQYCYLYAALNPYSWFTVQPDTAGYDQGQLWGIYSITSPATWIELIWRCSNEQRNKVLLIADGAGAHLEELCTDKWF